LLTKNLDADPDEANRTKTVKIHALQILVSLAIACGLIDAEQTRAAAGPAKSAFVFDGIGYLHRWSMNRQHEFTPEGQEDLEKWSDMITINVYPNAHDGEALATKANAVLENYKSHKGMVLKKIGDQNERLAKEQRHEDRKGVDGMDRHSVSSFIGA
jgi:hypothetical protein